MPAYTGREVHLASRPVGEPTAENFAVVEVTPPAPRTDEVLVRNRFLSVDPYMRGRMRDAPSYAPPYPVGAVMTGGAVGEVVESQVKGLRPGNLVLSDYGWREWAVGPAASFVKLDPASAPSPASFLGVLGMPGMTAYVGLLDIAGMRHGDVVFVSAAAGAVGSVAGQIAKLRGASTVIGSAGGSEKTRWLLERAGFDHALDYKAAPIAEQLPAVAPQGIDVYFDNVGGDHLEAAISSFRIGGRVAACGSISGYNDERPPPGPRNLAMVVGKRLTIRGFLVGDHADRTPDFRSEVGRWVAEGKLATNETVVDGIENMPAAFVGLLRGQNLGKMIVRVGDW